MYIGVPNPNILVPLEKMKIEPEGKSSFEVLYNPESYIQGREVKYAQSQGVATNTPVIQYTGGGAEVLQEARELAGPCKSLDYLAQLYEELEAAGTAETVKAELSAAYEEGVESNG